MSFFKIDERLKIAADNALLMCENQFKNIDSVAEYNSQKVLSAFINHSISESHFAASTGYGYNDRGRDTLEEVFAECVGAESALIRHNFVSGTHTFFETHFC